MAAWRVPLLHDTQQISVGKHRHGEIVDVYLNGPLLQIWSGPELLKTIVRTDDDKEVRKKRAAHTRRP